MAAGRDVSGWWRSLLATRPPDGKRWPTELVLPADHRLRPVGDIGAAAGLCHVTYLGSGPVGAFRHSAHRNRVGCPESDPLSSPGDIIEYNSLASSAMIVEWGGVAERLSPLADDYAALRLPRSRDVRGEYDLVIVNAGSSAGSEDLNTARIIVSG